MAIVPDFYTDTDSAEYGDETRVRIWQTSEA